MDVVPVMLVDEVVLVADVKVAVKDVELVIVFDVVVLVAPPSTVMTTVGTLVTDTVSPERNGVDNICSVNKVLISDSVTWDNASVLFAAASSAAVEPMDAGKAMT